jgi:hypothetical protein
MLLLAPVTAALAQTESITGTITDKDTKQPLGGVIVRVVGTAYGTMSKDNGKYTILGVPPGTYFVRAERMGFEPVEVSNVVVHIDVTRTMDVQLRNGSGLPPQVEPRWNWTPRPPEDPYTRCLIPPDLIMANQTAINLSEAQRSRIIAEQTRAQTEFTQAMWTMDAEMKRLQELLSATPTDEARALSQFSLILRIETRLKETQMGLLLRIKNALTTEQIATLRGMRGANSCSG